MKKALILAVLVVLACSGCSTICWEDGRDSIREGYKAKQKGYQAVGTYYEKQAKSYEAGYGGHVARNGGGLRASGFYQLGIVTSRQRKPITMVLSGSKGLSIDVEANGSAQIELPPGRYWQEIYKSGMSSPYRSGWIVIDSEGGDANYNGQSYDFLLVAP